MTSLNKFYFNFCLLLIRILPNFKNANNLRILDSHSLNRRCSTCPGRGTPWWRTTRSTPPGTWGGRTATGRPPTSCETTTRGPGSCQRTPGTKFNGFLTFGTKFNGLNKFNFSILLKIKRGWEIDLWHIFMKYSALQKTASDKTGSISHKFLFNARQRDSM